MLFVRLIPGEEAEGVEGKEDDYEDVEEEEDDVEEEDEEEEDEEESGLKAIYDDNLVSFLSFELCFHYGLEY